MNQIAESELNVSVEMIEIDVVKTSKTNPRKNFEREGITKLAGSISKHGLLNPIVVRVHPEDADCFEIIAGERRYRAAKKARQKLVLCRIIECDDATAIELQATENLDREALNPIEEAVTWQQLLDATGLTQKKLAARYNRSQPYVGNMLGLLKLPKKWQKRLINREIPFTFARDLVGWCKDPSLMYHLDALWDFEQKSLAAGQKFELADLRDILAQAICEISLPIEDAAPLALTDEVRELLDIRKLPETMFNPGTERIFGSVWDLNRLLEEAEEELQGVDAHTEAAPPERKQTELELAQESAEQQDQADQSAKQRIEKREERISKKDPAEVQANIEHAQQVADRNHAAKIDPQLYQRYKLEWLETKVTQAISRSNWQQLADALGVRMDVDWQLDEDFLKLHTRAQLLALAREWGFDLEDLQEYQTKQPLIEAMLVMDRQGRIAFGQGDSQTRPATAPLSLVRCEVTK